MDRSFPLLLLCFFLSGLAALVYETAWTREFAFVFGTSELAVATVLASYMGGLAAGAALAGRLMARIRRPVLAYGLLELGIALAALAVPLGIAASRALYVAVFGGGDALTDAGGLPTAIFYLVCSAIILLLPTAMMGATLPLLARHAVRDADQIGGRVGVLYAANTAGAVAGVLLAAFVLLPRIGLRATIVAAAGINAAVFAAAWALSRTAPPIDLESRAPAPEARGRAGWILPLVALSGFASFTYEVLWVRLLGHLVGSGVNAFATMLASFLLGIALGSAVASRLASSARRAAAGFGLAQLGTAALSGAAFAAVNHLPGLAGTIRSHGFGHSWVDVATCMATLFPAALCIGASFPFAVRVLAQSGDDAGPASARVYAWNTAGAIAGSIAAAFLLVPGLGFEGTLLVCIGANLLIAAAAGGLFEPRRRILVAAAAAGAVALALVPPSTPWGILRSSSMGGPGAQIWGRVAYYGVGRSSTVLVTDQRRMFALRTNGLPEAGMLRAGAWHNASPSTRWLTALPVFARPETRSMLVIGFGGGMLLEVVPGSVERIDVVELEPEVILANRKIAAERWRDPLDDPRIHLHLNDARNALLLADRRFDAIVSQPSHPWAGGAAHLYTQEFFERVESRLSEDGVFVQWIGLPFVDEELFRSLIAALDQTFDFVQAYEPPPGGSVLLLASNAALDPLANAARAIEANPEELALLGIRAPEDVVASLMLDEVAIRELATGAPPNRDGHNLLQSRSARLGDAALSKFDQAERLVADRDPLVLRRPADADRFHLLRRLHPPERMARVAASFEGPIDRLVGGALADIEAGRQISARRRLEEALAQAPRHVEARAALLRLSANAIVEGRDPGEILEPPLDEAERVLALAWQARHRDPGGAEVLLLDAALEAIPLRHPLGADAARVRALARLGSGDPEAIRDAVEILERTLSDRPDPRSMLLRADAFAAAGEHGAALETLAYLIARLRSVRGGVPVDALAHRALRIARATPVEDPELLEMRNHVLQSLRTLGRRG